jgi:hypothetical protein
MRLLFVFALAAFLSACRGGGSDPARTAPEKLQIVRPVKYSGMADASGGVAVTSNLFLVVDDEENKLRLYRADQPGPPVKEFDMSLFLEVYGKSLESDLEGAAKIGNRAFWISSHGRNREGKARPNRDRFFATDIGVTNGEVTLTPVGHPYKTLQEDLIADARFTKFHLAEGAERAPKSPGGFNIEGLSATPEGQLLIGFRSPVPQGKALLIPLVNPDDVIMGKRPVFKPAIQLDLDGLGIRDIAFHEGTYVIIAGSAGKGGSFEIYFWRGPGTKPERVKVKQLSDYHPEGIVIYPERGLGEIQILSDDGKLAVEGVSEREIVDSAKKSFRSFWLTR